jgi:hypothetical protein
MSRSPARRMQITPGKQHAALTFIIETTSRSGNRYALWSCTCGKQKEIAIKSVLYGQQKTCGCMGTYSKDNVMVSKEEAKTGYVTDEMIGKIASPFDFSLSEIYR